MAEVTSILREMQLGTQGGLVPARGSVALYSRRPSKFVKDDSAAIGATMARNKDVGSMVKAASWSNFGSEPGPKEERKAEVISKADAGNKGAAGSFTKADAGDKEAAGSFTGEVSITKAEGNKEAARSITAESSVAKAGPGNKETAGSFTGGICVTNAEPGNKKTAGSYTGEICATKSDAGNKEAAGKGVITEADWIHFVFLTKPPAGIEWEADATGINKERVPDSFIDILKKRRLLKKLPPPVTEIPHLRDAHLDLMTRNNYCVDLHADILRQLKQKGFAEVGIDFTDRVKKLFILPQH